MNKTVTKQVTKISKSIYKNSTKHKVFKQKIKSIQINNNKYNNYLAEEISNKKLICKNKIKNHKITFYKKKFQCKILTFNNNLLNNFKQQISTITQNP